MDVLVSIRLEFERYLHGPASITLQNHSSLLNLTTLLGWGLLAPEDFRHERLEFVVGDLPWHRCLHLGEHGLELLVRQVLTLAAEALLQVRLCDVPGIADVKVMESEGQVGVCYRLSSVDGNSEEFGVVYFAVVIEIDSFEDLSYLLFRHIKLVKGLFDLAELECARVIRIQCTEGVPQQVEVKCTRIGLIDEESECLNLESLWLAEVLDAAEHLQLLRIEKCWIVASVVRLNII